jgi:LacI family transcriptional regulator
VGIKDVAAAAGVSVGTVSNVLNRPAMVAEVTRERVLLHMRELGFVRNESARLLRAGRSRMIGLVVLDVGNPFFTDVARGVEEEAQAAGMALILCNSDDRSDKEQRYLELLEEQRVQGVLVTPTDAAAPQLAAMRGRGTPVVLVDRRADADACSVSVDDVAGGERVLQHLGEQGHRRVTFVGGPFTLPQVRQRHEGALRAAGGDVEVVKVVTEALNVGQGRRAAEDLLTGPARSRPTAVFCANDLLALGVLQRLAQEGVRVPQDVAIVGYDDIEFASAAAVPLSSVRQPREQLGRAAARLLLEEATDEQHTHQQLVFDPELVVRASSSYRRRPRR